MTVSRPVAADRLRDRSQQRKPTHLFGKHLYVLPIHAIADFAHVGNFLLYFAHSWKMHTLCSAKLCFTWSDSTQNQLGPGKA